MRLLLATSALFLFAVLPPASAQKEAASGIDLEQESKNEYSLENLFPKTGLFGPGARSMAFSSDGAFGAWLYRPYLERRHGPDLYLFEVATGKVTRVTSASVMAPFQESTRKVGEARAEKVRKLGAGSEEGSSTDKAEGTDAQAAQAKTSGTWGELARRAEADNQADADLGQDSEQDLYKDYDKVDESDAEDKEAPRYGGVSAFSWAPEGGEMLVSSGGDVYRLDASNPKLERLTKTRQAERNVAYLPDGSGFTCLAGDALVRVRFDEHFLDQLDPVLPEGMSMRQYALSPDGSSVVFLASDSSRQEAGRTVNIATYSDRFMKVREVPRTVSDDPVGDTKTSIYLYRLPDPQQDDGKLVQVYSMQRSGPRDILRLPDWAPDSSKVCFAAFEQGSSEVRILEASLPGASQTREVPDGGEEPVVCEAKVAHRFLHDGGPNTPRMMMPKYLADSRRIVLLTELAGFRHPYVLDPRYGTCEPLTRGRFEVYPLDLPKDRQALYALATVDNPARQTVVRIDLEDGSLLRLSSEEGNYSNAAVSNDGQQVLAEFTNYGQFRELVHIDVAATKQSLLTDSHPESTVELLDAKPSWFQYDNRHGQAIHGLMFKPEGLAKDEQRPLLIYVYGGPLGTRKQVTDGNYGSDAYLFASYMTRVHGYVTATIDPRGMSGYGALFEKANFEQVGKPQVEDLVDGVKYLIADHNVDPKAVGIHGWSFGGFQTQMCLYTEPEVFTCGIAGAGPTEWENYNSWYSTGTIGKSREGKTDLDAYSLLPLAKNLQGRLLLVHGMEDSNVLYQDTVRVYSELLKAGKETLVELFLDPTGGHGLGGLVERVGRARKYEEFLVRNLGTSSQP